MKVVVYKNLSEEIIPSDAERRLAQEILRRIPVIRTDDYREWRRARSLRAGTFPKEVGREHHCLHVEPNREKKVMVWFYHLGRREYEAMLPVSESPGVKEAPSAEWQGSGLRLRCPAEMSRQFWLYIDQFMIYPHEREGLAQEVLQWGGQVKVDLGDAYTTIYGDVPICGGEAEILGILRQRGIKFSVVGGSGIGSNPQAGSRVNAWVTPENRALFEGLL